MNTANPIARALAQLYLWVDYAMGKVARPSPMDEFAGPDESGGLDPEKFTKMEGGVWTQYDKLSKDLAKLPESIPAQTCRYSHYAFIRDLEHMKLSGPALRRRGVQRSGANLVRQLSALSTTFPMCNNVGMKENPGEATYKDLEPNEE